MLILYQDACPLAAICASARVSRAMLVAPAAPAPRYVFLFFFCRRAAEALLRLRQFYRLLRFFCAADGYFTLLPEYFISSR